jgi:hypothetical protein
VNGIRTWGTNWGKTGGKRSSDVHKKGRLAVRSVSDAKLFERRLGNLFGITDPSRADFNDLLGNDVYDGIVSINKAQGS